MAKSILAQAKAATPEASAHTYTPVEGTTPVEVAGRTLAVCARQDGAFVFCVEKNPTAAQKAQGITAKRFKPTSAVADIAHGIEAKLLV